MPPVRFIARADGAIVSQKVFATFASSAFDQVISDSLDNVFVSYDCPYAITGTVTSAVGEGGFSDLPAESVLRAKVIIGNDDTSSDYRENMQIAN